MSRQSKDKNNSNKFIKLPYFDWDKAKYFYYIARFLSLSEASKFLNISQPALSKKLAILENHLNCKLFIRKHAGLQLTRKGEELFVIIEKAFIDLKGFSYDTYVSSNNGNKRKIRISTTHAIASYILNEHLIDFNELHPDIIFDVIADDEIIDLVINDVDIAIRPYDTQAKGIEQDYLFSLERQLFASDKYLEKNGIPLKVEDLDKHHFVSFEHPEKYKYSDIYWSLKLGMKKNEIREPVYISNSLECLIEAAKNDIGIVTCYEIMTIIKKSGLKNILPLIKGEETKWYFTYFNKLKEDEKIQNIRDFLVQKFNTKKYFS